MKLKLTLSYDGADFYGSQRQNQLRTVQGELEKAISVIEGRDVTIKIAGRTDRGVHATGQVAAFDSKRFILPEHYKKALNSLLPADILIEKAEHVSDEFDPRRDAYRRDYLYRIKIGNYSPFLSRYALQIDKKLDLDSMKKAAKLFIGTHDFRTFSVGNDKESYVTTVFVSKIRIVSNWIYYKIAAVVFFRHMVRRIVGLLIDIGDNRYSPNIIIESFRGKAPSIVAANSCGLILRRVWYD